MAASTAHSCRAVAALREEAGMARKTRAARATRQAAAGRFVYQGAGAAILGNNPGIKSKAEADRAIAILVGGAQPKKWRRQA